MAPRSPGPRRERLIENSTDLCLKTRRATAVFTGQNGKVSKSRPKLAVKRKGKGSGRKHGHRGG